MATNKGSRSKTWEEIFTSGQKYVDWSDRYSVGISVIDDQHKKLLEMTNDLFLACNYSTDAGKIQFKKTIHDAVAYVKFHFATEEKIMKLTSYPDLEAHKKEHTDFVRKVFDDVKAFEIGIPLVPKQFVKYLKDWILSHIAITDSKMGNFLTDLKKAGKLGNITIKKKTS
jgi:hemerythrin